jgi:predicted enzyme related to lactoylglutathione lyase
MPWYGFRTQVARILHRRDGVNRNERRGHVDMWHRARSCRILFAAIIGVTHGSTETKLKEGEAMSSVSIRYMIDDVSAAIRFYTTHLGFALDMDASPAFASVSREGVRLLLSGKTSSGRRAMPDGREPVPGGWNRMQIQVEDLAAEVLRLRAAGVPFRNEIVTGPGGSQILIDDPSGNPVELFQPAKRG